LDQALELLQDLVDRFLRSRGEDHPDLAIVLNNLGAVLDTSDEAKSSRWAYDRAIAILDRGPRAGNPHLARCLNNLGALLISEYALDEAESHLVDAHNILCGVLGEDHVDSAQCSSNLGAIDLLRGHPAKAVVRLRQVLTVRERALGPDHPQTCSTRISLARALLAAGETQAGNEMITVGVQSLVEGLGAANWAVQALAAKHDQTEVVSLARAISTPEPSVRLGIEGVLDQVEHAFRTFEQGSAWSRGADGSYRMQLEVVDILFSHELLMNAP
jgi:Tetratricopeptide repeat